MIQSWKGDGVMIHRFLAALPTWAAAVAIMALASGCGPRAGTVSGQVFLDGKPLPGGMVTFLPLARGMNPSSSPIDAEGRYEVSVVEGEYQIAVDNRELEARSHPRPPPKAPPGLKLPPPGKADTPPREKEPSSPGKYVPIPEKYYNGPKSGLRITATGSPQEYRIELKTEAQ
jgi:hypothetical protein